MNRLELQTVEDHALAAEGIIVQRMNGDTGVIDTVDRLREALENRGSSSVVLIQRQLIGEQLMATIREGIATDTGQAVGGRYDNRWYGLGGHVVYNASPHVHEYTNCHVVPDPSPCPTAFFSPEIVKSVVAEIADSGQHPFWLRFQLRKVLMHPDYFFELLQQIAPPNDNGWADILACHQDIQRRTNERGGVMNVDYSDNGYGMVAIPPYTAHGRNVIDQRKRNATTGWRYFPTA